MSGSLWAKDMEGRTAPHQELPRGGLRRRGLDEQSKGGCKDGDCSGGRRSTGTPEEGGRRKTRERKEGQEEKQDAVTKEEIQRKGEGGKEGRRAKESEIEAEEGAGGGPRHDGTRSGPSHPAQIYEKGTTHHRGQSEERRKEEEEEEKEGFPKWEWKRKPEFGRQWQSQPRGFDDGDGRPLWGNQLSKEGCHDDPRGVNRCMDQRVPGLSAHQSGPDLEHLRGRSTTGSSPILPTTGPEQALTGYVQRENRMPGSDGGLGAARPSGRVGRCGMPTSQVPVGYRDGHSLFHCPTDGGHSLGSLGPSLIGGDERGSPESKRGREDFEQSRKEAPLESNPRGEQQRRKGKRCQGKERQRKGRQRQRRRPCPGRQQEGRRRPVKEVKDVTPPWEGGSPLAGDKMRKRQSGKGPKLVMVGPPWAGAPRNNKRRRVVERSQEERLAKDETLEEFLLREGVKA